MALADNLPVLEVKSDGWAYQLCIDSLYFFRTNWRVSKLFITVFVVGRADNRCKVKLCIPWIQKLVVNKSLFSCRRFFRFILYEHKIGFHRENTLLILWSLEFEIDGLVVFEFDMDGVGQMIGVHFLLMLEFLLGKLLIISGITYR